MEAVFSEHLSTADILIADPFLERATVLAEHLRTSGFRVFLASTLTDAKDVCLEIKPRYVVTELRFPDGQGLGFLAWLTDLLPSTRTVVHTWFADLPTTVAAIKAGATDFVPKPTDYEFLIEILVQGTSPTASECRIETPNRLRQEHIEQVVRFSGSNVSLAARKLQLDRRSLQRMLKRYASKQAEQTTIGG